ncbi:MAG: hypothetical protein U0Q18_09660 [Bryobacteraceae bacterium]
MSNQIRDEAGLSTTEYVATGDRRNDHEDQPTASRGGAAMAREEQPVQLFNETEAQEMRRRWSDIQTAFVDDPRTAVNQADELVGSATKRLTEMFSDARTKLEVQWDRGDNISTEDLRLALQHYRSFFQRLLSI